jgi:ketosteroid isomerase-like protein
VEPENARLVRELYEARARHDFEAIRSILADEVVWHEPDLGTEHTGDLHGAEAVLEMIREARSLTNGTFVLTPRGIVANGEHAVAMVDWSATREGKSVEGKEVAVYRIRDGRVAKVSFHQDDQSKDAEF